MADAIDSTRPIWIVAARVGAGHVQAALAIEEALAAHGLSDRVRVIDALDYLPRWYRGLYVGGYARLIARRPAVFGRLFDWTDRSTARGPTRSERLRIAVEARLIRGLRARFLTERPGWVVHTHFMAPAPMARWILRAGADTRQAVVVTDFHPHRIWLADGIDRYCVPNNEARNRLVSLGLAAAAIDVTGIPIRAKHRTRSDTAVVRRNFNWPARRPVVLIVAGADFYTGPLESVIDELAAGLPGATVHVVAGRNDALHARLRALQSARPNLRVVGFTERMHELLPAADVVLSKSGGVTTSECLAHGAALIALFPVPGQEECNADYLVSRGAGLKVTQAADALPAVRGLLDDPDRAAALRSRARALARPDAAEAVAAYTVLCDATAAAASGADSQT